MNISGILLMNINTGYEVSVRSVQNSTSEVRYSTYEVQNCSK